MMSIKDEERGNNRQFFLLTCWKEAWLQLVDRPNYCFFTYFDDRNVRKNQFFS